MKKINVRIVNKSINKLPAYSKIGDAGMDIRANKEVEIPAGKTVAVETGVYVQIPPGYQIQVMSRSGLAYNSQIFVLNAPGIIDSGYRGELKVILHNVSNKEFTVKLGDRIAQLVLQKAPQIKWVEVDKLPDSGRGVGGIGHTGVK